MPIRIVHVVASLIPGGLENGLVNVIARSDVASFEHEVVCLEAVGALAERLPPHVPVHLVGKRPGKDPIGLLRAVRLIGSRRPDIVHTRNWASLIEGALGARWAFAKHVHGLHGRTASELDGVPPRRRIIEGALSRRADRVYALLAALEPEVAALGVAPERRAVLENGVDLERFSTDAETRKRLRAELGVGEKDVLVGCVARLDPVKDHATLLRACAKLPAKASLVLAGEGCLRRSLEQLARVEGLAKRVRFLGHRPDPIFPALDVFVLPSRYEGFSNTILEAMACGLPVVATNVGGNPSLVSQETGVLVAVGDAQALGAALVKLTNEPKTRRALGEAGRRFAEARSLDRMARSYEELYRAVLANDFSMRKAGTPEEAIASSSSCLPAFLMNPSPSPVSEVKS